MISRVIHDERARAAARRARRGYAWASVVLMLALAGYGCLMLVRVVLP